MILRAIKRLAMTKNLQAIYENGVLRPLEPLELPDRKLVTVAICDENQGEPWLDDEFLYDAPMNGDDIVSLEKVRSALAKIPGALSEDFVAEREER
jgi:hypothetical protein